MANGNGDGGYPMMEWDPDDLKEMEEEARREREQKERDAGVRDEGGQGGHGTFKWRLGVPGAPMVSLKAFMNDLRIRDAEWLLRPYIPLNRLSVMYSKAGVAKSMTAIDWMLCSVTGKPWLGRFDLPRLKWAYMDFDAPEDQTKDYFARLMLGHDVDFDDPIFNDAIRLLDPENVIREFSFFRSGEYPIAINALTDALTGADVLVVDSLADAIRGGDEKEAEDCMVMFAAIESICRRAGVKTVIILHHERKQQGGGTDMARSSTVISAKPRGMVRLTSNKETGLISMTREKPRGYHEPIQWAIQNFDEFGFEVDQDDPTADRIRFLDAGGEGMLITLNDDDADGQDRVLAILKDADGLTKDEFIAQATAADMSERAASKWLKDMVRTKQVTVSKSHGGRQGDGRPKSVYRAADHTPEGT